MRGVLPRHPAVVVVVMGGGGRTLDSLIGMATLMIDLYQVTTVEPTRPSFPSCPHERVTGVGQHEGYRSELRRLQGEAKRRQEEENRPHAALDDGPAVALVEVGQKADTQHTGGWPSKTNLVLLPGVDQLLPVAAVLDACVIAGGAGGRGRGVPAHPTAGGGGPEAVRPAGRLGQGRGAATTATTGGPPGMPPPTPHDDT